MPVAKSKNCFRFGDVVLRFLGLKDLSLHAPPNMPKIMVLMDIAPVYVPDLLRMDVQDEEKLYVDKMKNRLVHRKIIHRSVDIFSKFINSHD